MGAFKYAVILESDTPPSIMLGQNIGGGIVKELKEVEAELLSASQLAKKYNLSVDTIRRKLEKFNQGTSGKCLYDSKIADGILSNQAKRGKGGARRIN